MTNMTLMRSSEVLLLCAVLACTSCDSGGGGSKGTPNHPPDAPALVQPADGAEDLASPQDLEVQVSDPDGEQMTVVFYGRHLTADADYTLAFLPDIEETVRDPLWAKGIFTAQTTWLRDVARGDTVNADAPNLAFVSTGGDMVYETINSYFQRGDSAISLIDGEVPYGLVRGNHDNSSLFNQYFPYTRYVGYPWYGGHYGSTNNNSYQFFSAGGTDYLMLHLEYLPSKAVVTWANAILQANQDRKAIVVTHAFISTSGERRISPDGADYLWKDLVKPNRNVFLVLCGHVHEEYTRIDTVEGRKVYQLLADYQDWTDGGSGYLRLLRFSPSTGTIHVKTYSPWLDNYSTTSKSQFDLDMPFTEIGRVSAVTSGAQAGVSWGDLPADAQCEWYACAIDARGKSTNSPVWRFSTPGAGLPEAAAIANRPPPVDSPVAGRLGFRGGGRRSAPRGVVLGPRWRSAGLFVED